MGDLEQKSIERIRLASEMSLHHYGQPLVCTYSGGKDSDVMLELFRRSGVPFEVINSHTTADAPPTVYHIRERFRRLEEEGIKATIEMPKMTMWQLIVKKKMPPTQIIRYCCKYLKESSGDGRMVATGVRWEESKKRRGRESFETLGKTQKDAVRISDKMLLSDNDKSRRLIEQCQMRGKIIVNPIIDWPDRDIWDFYWSECPMHNPLYKMGYYRVGCIGCPMARKRRLKEFSDFPTYKRAYIRAFEKMLEAIHASGKQTKWKTGEDVFRWWMEDENVDGQISLNEWMEEKC